MYAMSAPCPPLKVIQRHCTAFTNNIGSIEQEGKRTPDVFNETRKYLPDNVCSNIIDSLHKQTQQICGPA